jgi:hypothetical protein
VIAVVGVGLAFALHATTSSPLIDVLSLVVGLASICVPIAWAQLSGQSDGQLPSLAVQLAGRSRDQSNEDARANGLNVNLLQVTWTVEPNEVTDHEGRVISRRRLASTWADAVTRGQRPTGRWVVLGVGGAGKSALMVQLVRQLLPAKPEQLDGRVPLLVPLAAWDLESTLPEFLVSYLNDQSASWPASPVVSSTDCPGESHIACSRPRTSIQPQERSPGTDSCWPRSPGSEGLRCCPGGC